MNPLTIDITSPQRPSSSQSDNQSETSSLPEIDISHIALSTCLGEGTFGKVHKGTYGNRGFVAVKQVAGKGTESGLRKEIHLLHKFGGGSEHIVKLYGVVAAPGLGYVMEYMECGSLDQLLNERKYLQYRIDHVLSWLRQAASATAYMHSLSHIHRDLKPHNMLLSNRYLTLKLCDFGTVTDARMSMTTCRGSAPWMAPEVFRGRKYDFTADTYSLGIITWQMVTRKKPYPAVNPFKLLWNVNNGIRPRPAKCHPLLEGIITRMWAKEARNRPKVAQVEQFALVLMTIYNRYNEPLEETTEEGRFNRYGSGPRLSSGSPIGTNGIGHKGHRRGGSYETTLIKPNNNTNTDSTAVTDTHSSDTPVPSRPPRSHSFVRPEEMGNHPALAPSSSSRPAVEDVQADLEQHLRAVEPIWGDKESEDKQNEHYAFALAISDAKKKVIFFRKEKHELIARISKALEVNKLMKKRDQLERAYIEGTRAEGKSSQPPRPPPPSILHHQPQL